MPPRLRLYLDRTRTVYENTVHEITLRAEKPVCVYCSDTRYYICDSGHLVTAADRNDLIISSTAEVTDVFMRLCDYSVYSKLGEIVGGYITASSGIRVGLCGTAVTKDNRVTALKNITSLSFRVPRERIGCSKEALSMIDPLRGVMICGAPCSGKTTLIRDMARELSYKYKVSVIDERGEISASRQGISGFDMGLADVYVGINKGDGVLNSVRSLSPDIIICDEIGDENDAAAVRYALRCGAAFIATVHASAPDDLRNRRLTSMLLSSGAFGYVLFLDGRHSAGAIKTVYEWSDHDT